VKLIYFKIIRQMRHNDSSTHFYITAARIINERV